MGRVSAGVDGGAKRVGWDSLSVRGGKQWNQTLRDAAETTSLRGRPISGGLWSPLGAANLSTLGAGGALSQTCP